MHAFMMNFLMCLGTLDKLHSGVQGSLEIMQPDSGGLEGDSLSNQIVEEMGLSNKSVG